MTDTLLWVDVETVGLGRHYGNRILEIGWLFTGWDISPDWKSLRHETVYNPVYSNRLLTGRAGDVPVEGEDEVFERYGLAKSAVFAPHFSNGLLDEIIDPKRSRDLHAVLAELQADIHRHVDAGERVMLAGSSVGFDKSALTHAKPNIFDGLHYHVIDFSVLNETMDAWAPEAYATVPAKTTDHRVTTCLHGSVAQGQAYRGILSGLAVI